MINRKLGVDKKFLLYKDFRSKEKRKQEKTFAPCLVLYF